MTMSTTPLDQQQKDSPGLVRSFVLFLLRLVAAMVMLGALLFIPAGTLEWPMAWALIGVHLVYLFVLMLILLRVNPSLIHERSRLVTQDTKSWDKLLNPTLGVVLLGGWIVAGLDYRFGWSPSMSLSLQAAGLVVVILGYVLFGWAMVVNQYFSRVVRIQEDRGHQVCSDGPYQFVRHPGYAGFIPAFLGMALALGSWVALLPMAVAAALLILRTALEDRTLHEELPGYRDYATQVPFRLLPRVW
jgi:protein-S-isoprenylcysteine O-methyltransferase Ste14